MAHERPVGCEDPESSIGAAGYVVTRDIVTMLEIQKWHGAMRGDRASPLNAAIGINVRKHRTLIAGNLQRQVQGSQRRRSLGESMGALTRRGTCR